MKLRFLNRRGLCVALVLALLLPAAALGEVVITISGGEGSTSSLSQNAEYGQTAAQEEESAPAEEEADPSVSGDAEARAAFIDDLISAAKKEFDAVRGKAQEAQYSSSIFVCKNFTVYVFRSVADKYRMAEYPDVELQIPDNKPKSECTDYVYGAEWEEMSAQEGNPFYPAAEFRYDTALSKEENFQAALEFMRQAQKGDYFQMAANYYYGVGAHSLIFIADYNAETDTVRWTDSNMKGEKRNGIRYGYVQYDAEKKIDWFVDAFCRKKYGATIYRLRDDIIYAK